MNSIASRARLLQVVAALACLMVCRPAAGMLFTDAERAGIVAYWNAPGRYSLTVAPADAKTGPWYVRSTPEASQWFLAYQRAVGAAKAPPTEDPTASRPETSAWEAWVQAKLSYDRWIAQSAADAANATVHPNLASQTPATLPPAAGPIPSTLLATVGNPPPFAVAVTPTAYRVVYDDGDTYMYKDHVAFIDRDGNPRLRFAYYRFPQGVGVAGPLLRDMPYADLDPLFAAAGLTPFEQHVMRAVSRLEGGFEAINTYDTGFVSIGFIQFVTFQEGRGSLSTVLQREKADRPADFQNDFHRFGVDVDDAGVLIAVDPATGAELVGAAAVRKVIDDKRLSSVFQRAGRHTAFRVAQIEAAKSEYWPADDPIPVTRNGQTLTGKVSDIVKSEAGMATLFDRKVNRGTLAPFADIVGAVMAAHNLSALSDAAAYEREIVAAMKYRTDFLADAGLTQPK